LSGKNRKKLKTGFVRKGGKVVKTIVKKKKKRNMRKIRSRGESVRLLQKRRGGEPTKVS